MNKKKFCTLVIFFSLSLTLLSNNNQEAKKNVSNQDSTLVGIWGLTNYFDTIVTHKELAKHRLQHPTWFAILLKIDQDSIEALGSIEHDKYPLNSNNDTLVRLQSFVTGVNWCLVKKSSTLQLISSENEGSANNYIFRKREDLKDCFTDTYRGEGVSQYFGDNLFVGKYVDVKTKQKTEFGTEGKLKGLKGYDKYVVRSYFGLSHPHKNLDVITFYNQASEVGNDYNWVFFGDQLILTDFVSEESYDEEGKPYKGDDFVLGKEQIILKRLP